jgi:ribosomal-protein-alanine N-acetyltransferase
MLRRAGFFDAELLAALHAVCFPEDPWDAAAFRHFLTGPGMFAILAGVAGDPPEPAGFMVARAIAGEAEIVTFGVVPACRGTGLGAALLAEMLVVAEAQGAEAVFLEVAEDNLAAHRLYTAHGFIEIGRRPNYYRRNDHAVAALVMKRQIIPSGADHS